MAHLSCPHCGSRIASERTWAQTAVSTLVAAPAVPDMATQVRCPRCGRLSAASDMRVDAAGQATRAPLLLWGLAAALLAWLLLR